MVFFCKEIILNVYIKKRFFYGYSEKIRGRDMIASIPSRQLNYSVIDPVDQKKPSERLLDNLSTTHKVALGILGAGLLLVIGGTAHKYSSIGYIFNKPSTGVPGDLSGLIHRTLCITGCMFMNSMSKMYKLNDCKHACEHVGR